ncbi:MAG: CDP-diacylglycerol--serine O-phosphatidyltransferase [bacterium]|nr:CDP-diacylglycerol--serine O-phosphatidyltransferase [candidate division KSB1 bacterium]MDH7561056.1 CDP-diacylglycerol--serine O-phosphatidyltransferase [bacterium]
MNRRALLADVFTALNMLCGFLGILAAVRGRWERALWLVFIAAIFDGLDGKFARAARSGQTSDFGLQLDSLSDVISFGVLPGVLAYEIFLNKLGVAGVAISFLPVLCSALRLARFNVLSMSVRSPFYVGLPAPMATLTICGFIWMDALLPDVIGGLRLLPVVVAGVSLLMVSRLPYDRMPHFAFSRGAANTRNLLIFLFGLVFIPLFPRHVFFPLMMVYVVAGIVRGLRGGPCQAPARDRDSKASKREAL